MAQALHGDYGLTLLVALVVAKILAVSLTIGSGGSGGIFAPSLFIGAMLGTAFGTAAHSLLPGITAAPGAYGLVGMAAVFAGAARAPITSVIILFELTGDYRIILPLMLAVVISTLISEALSADTIYTLKLRRRGIDVRAGRDVDLMRSDMVAEAMSRDIPTAQGDMTVAEASDRLEETHERALVVVNPDAELDGIATIQDLEQAMLDNKPGLSLEEVASRPVVTVFPDQSLSEAIHALGLHDHGQAPMVSRLNPHRVVGLLRRGDIVRAYSRRMLESLETQRHRPVSPRELRGGRVVEVTLSADGLPHGGRVADLHFPADALILTIERDHQTVIPRGDTSLLAGDRLLILVPDEGIAALQDQLDRARSS
jgi:CIC family chloride channel protein